MQAPYFLQPKNATQAAGSNWYNVAYRRAGSAYKGFGQFDQYGNYTGPMYDAAGNYIGPNMSPQHRGVSGLTFDGSGLLGTGIFGNGPWDWSEWLILAIGAYALFSIFYTTQETAKKTTQKAASAFEGRRRSRAAKLRAQAKQIEEQKGPLERLFFG